MLAHSLDLLRHFFRRLQFGFAFDKFGTILRILRIKLRIDVADAGRRTDRRFVRPSSANPGTLAGPPPPVGC